MKQFGIKRRSAGRLQKIIIVFLLLVGVVVAPIGTVFADSASEGVWTTADINVNGSSAGWSNVASSEDGMKLIASNWTTNAIQTSSNGGVSWTTHTLGRWPFNAVASSADGMKLFALGVGIYTSTDGGINWTELGSTGGSNWLSIASSADGTKLVAGKDGYVYTSIDSGATWTEHASLGSGYWSEVASSSDGTKLVAAEVYGGDNNGGAVYTSTDSGATWTERPAAGKRIWDGVTISGDGSTLAASVNYDNANDTGGYIYTSTDGGATWIERTSAGVRNWNGIDSSAQGSKLVATDGESGSIYTSTDSGATWTERSFPDPCNWGSVVSSADGSKILAACSYGYGPLYTSVDSGATWAKVDSIQTPNNQWRSLSSSADGTKLIAGGMGNNGTGDYVRTSDDSGNTWVKQQGLGLGHWGAVAYSADGAHMAAADPWGSDGSGIGGYLYTSSNGGTSWVEQASLGLHYWTGIKMSFNGMKIIAATDKVVFISNDSGATWTERTPATGVNSWWQSVAMSMDGSKLFAADTHGSDDDYDGGHLYVSSDGGVSWAEVSALGKGHWTDIAISADGTKIVVSEYYHSIYTSTDSGATWVERNPSGMRQGWSRVASSSDGQKLIATLNNFNNPPYASADGGDTWFPLNTLGVTDNYDGWGPVTSSYDGRKVAVGAYTGAIHLGTFPYPAIDPVFPTVPPVVNVPSPSPEPVIPAPTPVPLPHPHEPLMQNPGQRAFVTTTQGNGDVAVKSNDESPATPANQLEADVAFYSGKGQALKLEKGGVVKFRAADGPHTATIDDIEGDKVTFTLRSTPQTVSLKIGQTGKYDVNEDGKSDISVTLLDINGGIANLSFAALAAAPATPRSDNPPGAASASNTIPLFMIIAGAVTGVVVLALVVKSLKSKAARCR